MNEVGALKCPRCCCVQIGSYDDTKMIDWCAGCGLFYCNDVQKWYEELPGFKKAGESEFRPSKVHDCPQKSRIGGGEQGLPYFQEGCPGEPCSHAPKWVMEVARCEYSIEIWFCPYCGERLP